MAYGFLLLFAFVQTISYHKWFVDVYYTTCSFLQSMLTIWMRMSCSYDMSYLITFDIWEVRIMSFLLLLFQVSWVHSAYRPATGDFGFDLLTIGNSTYTLDSRISARFAHPTNWGLKIDSLRPEDAGAYICQISTFPKEKVRIVYLEIRGETGKTAELLRR